MGSPGLLSTELWEYGLGDLIRNLPAAWSPTEMGSTIHIAGLGESVPARSARAAIVIALRALDFRPGARIGVPLYCCPVVFKAIATAGCTPVFLDSDPETYCLSPVDLAAKYSRLDAVIAVHMFGNPCDMTSIGEIMKGKPIIEDCAQSLGSRLNGRPTGSFGTIAAFSFRSGKYLSVGEGGALFSAVPELRSRISSSLTDLPVPSRKEETAHLLLTLVRSKLRRKPLWGLVGRPLWSAYDRNVDFAAKSPIVQSRIFRSDLALTRRRLDRLDSTIEAQKSHARFYARTLRLESAELIRETPGAEPNGYLFPITFPSRKLRDLMAASMLSRSIGTSKPYDKVAEGAARFYGYQGDCPGAEQIAERVLVIPCHHELRQGDLERISECLNKEWQCLEGGKKRT